MAVFFNLFDGLNELLEFFFVVVVVVVVLFLCVFFFFLVQMASVEFRNHSFLTVSVFKWL